MARYALNVINPTNWQSQDGVLVYVSPPEEAQHLAELQAKNAQETVDFRIDAAILSALENAKRSSAKLAEHAIAYAKRLETAVDISEHALWSQRNTIVSASMIVARDGTDELLDEHEEWLRRVFAKTFHETDHDSTRALRDGVRFNPVAIATLGIIYLWQRRRHQADRDTLLDLAGHGAAEAAHGFGAGLQVIREMDPRLIPALLRCALTAQVQPAHNWKTPQGKKAADYARHRERVNAAIAAERAWLGDEAVEPTWPRFPAHIVYVKHGIRIGGDDDPEQTLIATDAANDELRSHSAAIWVRQLTHGLAMQHLRWLAEFVKAYAQWTANANGAGCEPHVDIDNRPGEWNSIFIRLLAHTFTCMTPDDAAAEVMRAVTVPDESFFDIAAELVPAIDDIYFSVLGNDLNMVLRLRGIITDRLMASDGWRRERDRTELSVEMHIGPAIGALFFNYYHGFRGARCYLLGKGIDQVDPFLSQITRMIEDGPVPFTALLTMNLLEVSPKSAHAGFFLSSALVWLRRQPDNTRLWVDGGLGFRLANWLEALAGSDASFTLAGSPFRAQMDDVLARLIKVGVAEAYSVERAFAHAT
jgi:hypothetical protein